MQTQVLGHFHTPPFTTPGHRPLQVSQESRIQCSPIRISRRGTQFRYGRGQRGKIRLRADGRVDLAVLPLHQVLRRVHGGRQGGNSMASSLHLAILVNIL